MSTRVDDDAGPVGTPELDAVVIGAGFAGLYMLHRLRGLALTTRLFERGDGVGGTWYWNRYPGARCDTESYVYCYSFDEALLQEWNWSGKYPTQPEILFYLNHVADRLDLRRDITFSTRVTGARFIEDRNWWEVYTDQGQTVTTRFLITGLGLLSAGYVPDLPGIDTFDGLWLHTSNWPQDGVDPHWQAGRDHRDEFDRHSDGSRHRRSGRASHDVPAHPSVHHSRAPRVSRSPLPRSHQGELRRGVAVGPSGRKGASRSGTTVKSHWTPPLKNERNTYETLWQDGGFKFLYGAYKDLLTDRRANDTISEFVRARIRERVKDPEIAEMLIPNEYPFGARRPIIDTDYFEIYNRDDVTLADIRNFPIVEMTPGGLRTEAGEFELDVLIFATGFDAVTGPVHADADRGPPGPDIAGQVAGRSLHLLGPCDSGLPESLHDHRTGKHVRQRSRLD